MALDFKTLTVRIAGGDETFQIALLNGSEPSALLDAVRGRVKQSILADSMYFTIGSEATGIVVPLSAALPDGAELTLHAKASPPTQQDKRSLTPQPGLRQRMFSGGQRRGRPSSRDPPARQTSGIPAAAPDDASVLDTASEFETQASGSILTVEEKPQPSPHSIVAPLPSDKEGRGKDFVPMSAPLLGSDSKEDIDRVPSSELSSSFRGEDGARRSRSSSALRRLSTLAPWKRYDTEVAEDRKANQEAINALTRFGRINTDMGNERTVLAWQRTCLAAMRTVFTFLNLGGTTNIWDYTVYAGLIGCAIYMTLCCVVGHLRYVTMKQLLTMTEIPLTYSRFSLRWCYWVLLVMTILVVVGSCTQQWVKK